MQRMKNKVFYQSLIRYSFVNCIKFNTNAVMAIVNNDGTTSQVAIGVSVFLSINLLVLVYAYVLYKRRDDLGDEANRSSIGNLYSGLQLHTLPLKNQRGGNRCGTCCCSGKQIKPTTRGAVCLHPVVFMVRRMLFALASVLLFDHPAVQIISHHVMQVGYLCYICQPGHFADEKHWVSEVTSESLGLVLSALFMQFVRFDLDKDQEEAVTVIFVSTVGLMLASSIAFMVYFSASQCLR